LSELVGERVPQIAVRDVLIRLTARAGALQEIREVDIVLELDPELKQ